MRTPASIECWRIALFPPDRLRFSPQQQQNNNEVNSLTVVSLSRLCFFFLFIQRGCFASASESFAYKLEGKLQSDSPESPILPPRESSQHSHSSTLPSLFHPHSSTLGTEKCRRSIIRELFHLVMLIRFTAGVARFSVLGRPSGDPCECSGLLLSQTAKQNLEQ